MRQHAAVSPRHGLRRCLASRGTTAAPCGARRSQDTKTGLKPDTKSHERCGKGKGALLAPNFRVISCVVKTTFRVRHGGKPIGKLRRNDAGGGDCLLAMRRFDAIESRKRLPPCRFSWSRVSASILSITNPKCQYGIILINACQTPYSARRLLVVFADALLRLPRNGPLTISRKLRDGYCVMRNDIV